MAAILKNEYSFSCILISFAERCTSPFQAPCRTSFKVALILWGQLINDIDIGFMERVNINVDVKVRIRNTGDII